MPLYQPVIAGDLQEVDRLLRQGADAEAPDPKEGLTPLMHAARSPQAGVDMMRLLVRYGAQVNGWSTPPPPFSQEMLDNIPEEVKKQIPNFYQTVLNPPSKPVLYYALKGGDRLKIDYLITAGADLYYQHSEGYDILADAMYKLPGKNKFDTIKWLIEEKGAQVVSESGHGDIALNVASSSARFDIVELLLRKGADTDLLHWTPLMHAALFGTEEQVKALLKNTPYTDERDRFDRTALLLAVQAGRLEIVRALLQSGASLEERGQSGQTPLMYAAAKFQLSIVAFLLEEGASVHATDEEGNNALLILCQSIFKDTPKEMQPERVLRMLLEAGSDPWIENEFGDTPANTLDSLDLFQILVEYGVDWNEASDPLKRELMGLPAIHSPHVSQKVYEAGKKRRFGKENPEVMTVPFWDIMVKSGASAGSIRLDMKDTTYRPPGSGHAVWCYDRYGKSFNLLPDGRIIEIAGEYEDFYDPDFCIYNDVVVFNGQGGFTMYGYPKEVFPPTDFHTATLLGDHIYIIGNLGYSSTRIYGHTPVYQLNIHTFVIQRVETSGDHPGWIHKHKAMLQEDEQIKVWGGIIAEPSPDGEEMRQNEAEFILDLNTMRWSKIP